MWEGLQATLEGASVRLEPLAPAHADGLWAAAQDERIWTWLPGVSGSRTEFDAWMAAALEESRAGREVAWATVDIATARPIGSTRFLALRPEHRGLEIGWTWVAPEAWGTGVNVEAKLLQLAHAFERLDCLRVELKTHASNERSRGAMTALGARFEGIFRKHMVLPGGEVRDSAYFSIVDDEWPEVRAGLERRLAALRGRERRPGPGGTVGDHLLY